MYDHILNMHVVWDPYLIKDIKEREVIQKFACKLCTGNWYLDYTSSLSLHLQSLSVRRKYLKLIMIFNIFNSNLFFPDQPIRFTNINKRTIISCYIYHSSLVILTFIHLIILSLNLSFS